MNKEDLIYDMIRKIDQENREDHQKIFEELKDLRKNGKGLTFKEWGIISGMVTTICGTVSGIFVLIFK